VYREAVYGEGTPTRVYREGIYTQGIHHQGTQGGREASYPIPTVKRVKRRPRGSSTPTVKRVKRRPRGLSDQQ